MQAKASLSQRAAVQALLKPLGLVCLLAAWPLGAESNPQPESTPTDPASACQGADDPATAWGGACLTDSQGAVPPWVDYDQQVEESSRLAALEFGFAGEQINRYDGATTFAVTDIDLPGNFDLPVRLTRRLAVSIQPQDQIQPYDTRLGGAGNWDVDVPWMAATYPASSGWNDQRCSLGSVPPLAIGPHGRFQRAQVWQGITVHVPGQDERRAMGLQTGVPQPSSGGPYRLTSSQRDVFSCIPMQSGLAGEGFRMTTREGLRYDFDVAVTRTASKLVRPLKINGFWQPFYLDREHYYLLASRIEDRHGNTVEIDYNAAGHPTRINASDGREIVLTYASGRLSSATANGRTWQYQYQSGRLVHVELPDGSQWDYVYTGNLKPPAPAAYEDLVLPWCRGYPAQVDADYVLQATHPAGAQAEFEFTNQRHYRSGVHATECIAYGQGDDAVYDLGVPHYFDVMSLVHKTLSGPGLTQAIWTYDYDPSFALLWGSPDEPANYPCTSSEECRHDKQVTITRPDGSQTIERYGMVYRHNDGRLLERRRLTAGSSTTVRTELMAYLAEEDVAGQPFHDHYGTVLGGVGDPLTARVRSIVQSSLTQEGTTYTRSINTFDALARAQETIESNSTGASQAVVFEYYDDTDLWVLGQIEKTTIDGIVAEQISYTATSAQPRQRRAFGRLLSTQAYNGNGTLKRFTDGSSNITRFSQWYRGIPGRIEHPDGSVQTASIDDNGWIESVTDEIGATTQYEHDLMGRTTRIVHPVDAGQSWQDTEQDFEPISQGEYGLAAGHWRQTRSVGRERVITYFDGLWRPVVKERFDNSDKADTLRQTVTRYDRLGRVAFKSWPINDLADYAVASLGQHTSHDALDRVTETRIDSELGPLITTTDYLSGNRIQTTDPKGYITETTYQAFAEPADDDPLGITFAQGTPLEVTTTVARDVFGNPLTMQQTGSYQGQSLSVVHTFGYNAHRQRCRHTGPETATTAYGYDGAGNLDWKAEGLAHTSGCPTESSLPAGSKITYQYDSRNRLTGELYPAGSADKHFSYDDNGRLETATRSAAGSQPASTWTLQWYKRGLLESETLAIDGHQFTLNHGYNSEGHRASLTYPGGRTTNFSPNGLGRPTRLGSYATNIHYAPNGQPKTHAYGNGVQAQYDYNTRQLRRQTIYTLSGTALSDRTLQYDPNGNLTVISASNDGPICGGASPIFCSRFEAGGAAGPGSRSFVYDELDRLLEVVNPLREDQFSYDPLGNIRTASALGTWHYDAHNRIDKRIGAGTTDPHAWDGRGNLTDDGQRSYTWNRANELIADGDGGQYAYDANGWRVYQKRGSGQPVYSVYDQQQRLMVRLDTQTGTQTNFIYLGRQPIARIEGSQTTYIHPNDQNSPLLETDATGAITRQPVYLGYGQTDAEGTSEIPGYTGAAMDPATGQTYLGARYLHQNRFTSPDPAELDPARPAGLNRYAYGDNNPIRYTDPDGRESVGEWIDSSAQGCGMFSCAGFAAANALWTMFGAEGISQIADKGWSAAGNQSLFGAGLEAAAVLPPVRVARAGVAATKGVARGGDATKRGGLNLFKWNHPTSTSATGWREGDRFLHLPNQGSPRANWVQNSSRLRSEMRSGNAIFDSYQDASGQLIPTRGFLNAERNLLQNQGWRYNPSTGAWHPSGEVP